MIRVTFECLTALEQRGQTLFALTNYSIIMNAIRIRTQINQDNGLILKNLPLPKGKHVEVIILEDDAKVKLSTQERFPLRGKSIRFDDPFGSASDEIDWEVMR